MIRLGVLHAGVRIPGISADAQIRDLVRMAREIEALGYSRIWLAEHHEAGVSFASPEILLTAIAATTRSIRVGSGGVLLHFHSPLKIAESFRALEALYPERIDLGVSAGLTADEETRQALSPGFDMETARSTWLYARKADELVAFCRNLFPSGDRFEDGPVPHGVPSPPLYFLGSGTGLGNMKLAARLGTPFCYSLSHGDAPNAQVIEAYRDEFRPSTQLHKPYAILTGNLLCAEQDVEAVRRLEGIRKWMPEQRVSVLGSPARCIRKIAALLEQYACDEFLIMPIFDSLDAMRRGLEQLSAANYATPTNSTKSMDKWRQTAR